VVSVVPTIFVCVGTWRCVSKGNYVKRKTRRSIGFQIRHILLCRYVNIFVLYCVYVYVIKPAQAVKLMTGIWQIIISNLGRGTIFFILYQYLTLSHGGVRTIY
jgi:hypothetical protein